jgi:SAM-dependent methyltransferase
MSQPINYETSWLIAEASARTHVLDALQSIQKDYAVIDRRVVELGCGIGTNLAVFAAANPVIGVEGLPAAVQECRRRGIEGIVGDIEGDIPLADASADWVLCIDVLEHLVNPAQCLASARRILRAGGHLIVNVPNHFDLSGRLRILGGSGIDSRRYFPASPHWSYPHIRFFSRRSIGELLGQLGFEVVEDYGPRFLSFPKLRWWQSLGMSPVLRAMQARWPDLLSSGFFLVCRKQ